METELRDTTRGGFWVMHEQGHQCNSEPEVEFHHLE